MQSSNRGDTSKKFGNKKQQKHVASGKHRRDQAEAHGVERETDAPPRDDFRLARQLDLFKTDPVQDAVASSTPVTDSHDTTPLSAAVEHESLDGLQLSQSTVPDTSSWVRFPAPGSKAVATEAAAPSAAPAAPASASAGEAASATSAGATGAGATAATASITSPFMGLLAGLGGIAAVAAASKSSSSTPTQTVSGSVADGYISGADVYVDVNKNGKVDQGDIKVGTTNASGKFSGTIDQTYASYNLLVVGGKDTSTQLDFKGILKAPASYSVVNPLTTLVSYLKDAGVANAEAKVLSALGLTDEMQSAGASLASFDPLAYLNSGAPAHAVAAVKVQAVALQVANVIVTGSAAVVGASSSAGAADKIDDAAQAVMTAFADTIKTGASFDLTDGSKITTLLSSNALKTAAASAGLTLDNTRLTSKAAAAGLALDAVNTAIGDAVAGSTSADAVTKLASAIQAQYVAQNISGNVSTSLMSTLLSSSDSTDYVQNTYDSASAIQELAAAAPLPQLDPSGPSVKINSLVGTQVSGLTYNLTGTLSKALSSGEHVRISYNGGESWSTVADSAISGTTITLTGKTLGASAQVLAKVVDANGKFGLGFTTEFLPPSVSSVTDDVDGTVSASTTNVAYTYTFSEVVLGLSAEDFSVVHGTISSVTGNGKIWTVNVTPELGVGTGAIEVTLNAQTVTDVLGNRNASSSQNDQAIDTLEPGVESVTDNVEGTANINTSTVAYTYTFSEAVTGLTADDFTVVHGDVTSVEGEGATWTVTVVPHSGVASGNIELTLNAGAVLDAAGNTNVESTQSDQAIDTVAPETLVSAVQLSADTGAYGNDNTDFITQVASQTITGSLSALLAAGEKVYVSADGGANWELASATEGSDTWSIENVTLSGADTLEAKVVDAAGNDGEIAFQAYVLDNTAPVLTLDALGDDLLTRSEAENFTQTFTALDELTEVYATTAVVKNSGGVEQSPTMTVADGQITGDLSGLNDGDYTLVVTSVDIADNVTVQEQSFTVDKTAPLVQQWTPLAFGDAYGHVAGTDVVAISLSDDGLAINLLFDHPIMLGTATPDSFTFDGEAVVVNDLSISDVDSNISNLLQLHLGSAISSGDLNTITLNFLGGLTDFDGRALSPFAAASIGTDDANPATISLDVWDSYVADISEDGLSISVTFNESVARDASVPDDQVFVFSDDIQVDHLEIPDGSSNVVVIHLSQAIARDLDHIFQMEYANGVTDLAGNPLPTGGGMQYVHNSAAYASGSNTAEIASAVFVQRDLSGNSNYLELEGTGFSTLLDTANGATSTTDIKSQFDWNTGFSWTVRDAVEGPTTVTFIASDISKLNVVDDTHIRVFFTDVKWNDLTSTPGFLLTGDGTQDQLGVTGAFLQTADGLASQGADFNGPLADNVFSYAVNANTGDTETYPDIYTSNVYLSGQGTFDGSKLLVPGVSVVINDSVGMTDEAIVLTRMNNSHEVIETQKDTGSLTLQGWASGDATTVTDAGVINSGNATVQIWVDADNLKNVDGTQTTLANFSLLGTGYQIIFDSTGADFLVDGTGTHDFVYVGNAAEAGQLTVNGFTAGLDTLSLNASILTLLPHLTGIATTLQSVELATGDSAEITFTFSESVSLNLTDLTVSGGELSQLTMVGDGSSWTAQFTASESVTDAATQVSVNNWWLDASQFLSIPDMASLSGPQDANDYLIFDESTGALAYDDDGSGSNLPVVLLTLTDAVDRISAGEFNVIDNTSIKILP